MIGSELEPVKIRKALGSIDNLIDRILERPVFEESQLRIASILEDSDRNYSNFIIENQKKILAFEGFSHKVPKAPDNFEGQYLKWSSLINNRQILEVEPGTPGNPDIPISRYHLKLIHQRP